MYYTFTQNNSGGSFDFDEKKGISHHVIISADNAADATMRAEKIGLYFDGCDSGQDCNCCGDRWYKPYNETGTVAPRLYGELPSKVKGWKWMKGPEGFIHYKNGRIKPFDIKKGN